LFRFPLRLKPGKPISGAHAANPRTSLFAMDRTMALISRLWAGQLMLTKKHFFVPANTPRMLRFVTVRTSHSNAPKPLKSHRFFIPVLRFDDLASVSKGRYWGRD
jgi:hypothetical protein